MKIYTRTGDDGRTNLPDGQRVSKCDPLVQAGGAIDELNAELGLCLVAAAKRKAIAWTLSAVQGDLMTAGAMLAATGGTRSAAALTDKSVAGLEQAIDDASDRLPELKHFILPRGCELAARLHVARTVCRRTERELVSAADVGTPIPPVVLRYLNRLSDLLFTLSRLANLDEGFDDPQWHG